MNDTYRELLRQYFQAKELFHPMAVAAIEKKLKEAVGYERPSQSPQPLHQR